MKERSTMQRLMQEGWVPILIGTLSASVIVSLAHSTGMAYVTAFLLMTLYFVAIAANRVNARTILTETAKWILHQFIRKIGEILGVRGVDDFRENVRTLWTMQIDGARNYFRQVSAALSINLAGLEARIEAMLLALIVPAGVADSGGAVGLAKNGKIALSRIIQVVKSAL